MISTIRLFKNILRNALALLAAAALLITALTLVSQHSYAHATSLSSVSPSTSLSQPQAPFHGWNSVVIGLGHPSPGNPGKLNLYNYNPVNGHRTLLVTPTPPADTIIDGVSRDGQNVLYHVPHQSGHTLYYTLHQVPNTGFFFELNDSDAGNAIWEPDNLHVLVNIVNAKVIEVNAATGASDALLPLLKTPHLEFVYGSYLYFIGGADRDTGALYRLNVTDGIIQQVTTASRGSTYWISPDGSTVYYANHGPAGGPGIYAVNSDGTNLRVLRPDGEPIGYAADNSLIIMLKVNSKFEIVKLGATIQQDFVLLADATPGASSAEMALAPYGHAVIVLGMYADGSQKIWSDDLITDKQFVMVTPAKSSTQVQLPGWDRIAVA